MLFVRDNFRVEDRPRQKQMARALDAAGLANRSASPAEMREKNGAFSKLPLRNYRMAAIGGKLVGC